MWTFTSTGVSLFASGETSVFLSSEIDQNITTTTLAARNGITNTGVFMPF